MSVSIIILKIIGLYFFDQKIPRFSLEGYLWDKILNEGFKIKNYQSSKPYFSKFHFTDENSAIRVWNSDTEFFSESIIKELASDLESPLYPILQNYDIDEDNPILIFYTFKNK